MFQASFIALTMLETGFFVYRKKVDPLGVAFGSAFVYFTPGLLGFSIFLYRETGGGTGQYLQPIAPSAYVAMSMVILSLGLGAVIADRLPKISLPQIGGQRLVPGILLAFALGAAAVSVWRTGAHYLCTDKEIVLQKVDVWYSYAALAAPLCVVAAVAVRNWTVVALGTVLLLADLYAGFRTGIAISLLSLAMVFEDWAKGGRRRLAVYVSAIVTAGFLLIVVKGLIGSVKYAASSGCPVKAAWVSDLKSNAENVELVIANLTSSQFYWRRFLSAAEPSVTQAVLNEVARTGFSTEAGYLIDQLSAGVPLGESLFGIDSRKVVSFNTMFQRKLFPSVAFTMANNPWAQALAAGGFWMVGIFSVAFTSLLVALNVLFRATSGAVRGGVAVTAAWIGFYFHRNDLFVEIVLLKHVVYIFTGTLAIAWLASLILRERRPKTTIQPPFD
jgi:hypothetical protein